MDQDLKDLIYSAFEERGDATRAFNILFENGIHSLARFEMIFKGMPHDKAAEYARKNFGGVGLKNSERIATVADVLNIGPDAAKKKSTVFEELNNELIVNRRHLAEAMTAYRKDESILTCSKIISEATAVKDTLYKLHIAEQLSKGIKKNERIC